MNKRYMKLDQFEFITQIEDMKFSLVEVQQEEIKHSNSLFKAISRSKLQISSVDKIQTSSFINNNTPNYFH